MIKQRSRALLMVALLLLGATGCLRSASDADFEALQSRDLSTATLTPTPLTLEVVERSITEVIIVTATPGETTPEVLLPLLDTPEATLEDVQGNIIEPQNDEGTAIAQAEENPAEATLRQQATDIISTATQESINATLTAEGPQIVVPTFTPTLDPIVATPTPTNIPVGTGIDCIHEVRAGENLFRLSLLYGVLVNDIARASGISNPNLILVGQRLTIPGCGTTGVTPPPTSQPTATFSLVSGGTGTGTTGSVVGGSAGGVQHTVQQGETLFEISLRYGVPVMTIAAANGIANIDLIKLNTVLTIP
ncbi:MAG: hypothetical protein OHK0046_05580 [Anaerolineae bacterium]